MNVEISRQLAKDETTASKILANLARSEDDLTRKYVASNPNTPTEVLLNICFKFPKEVINNSVIPLLILENPYLLTCKTPVDFNEAKRLTGIEIKRLGWTTEQKREYLKKNYRGKRSRLHLTDEEILNFLGELRAIR